MIERFSVINVFDKNQQSWYWSLFVRLLLFSHIKNKCLDSVHDFDAGVQKFFIRSVLRESKKMLCWLIDIVYFIISHVWAYLISIHVKSEININIFKGRYPFMSIYSKTRVDSHVEGSRWGTRTQVVREVASAVNRWPPGIIYWK